MGDFSFFYQGLMLFVVVLRYNAGYLVLFLEVFL